MQITLESVNKVITLAKELHNQIEIAFGIAVKDDYIEYGHKEFADCVVLDDSVFQTLAEFSKFKLAKKGA